MTHPMYRSRTMQKSRARRLKMPRPSRRRISAASAPDHLAELAANGPAFGSEGLDGPDVADSASD